MPDEAVKPPPPAPPDAKLDPAKLLEEIDALLGTPDDHIPIPALPRGSRFVWGWIPDPEGKMALINVGHEWPYAKAMTVIAMFQDDTEVRVYALGNATDKPLPPTRYTVTKAAPSIFSESMPLGILKAELAKEYAILENRTLEPEDVPEFIAELLDDDEDEDAPEEEKKPNGQPATVT